MSIAGVVKSGTLSEVEDAFHWLFTWLEYRSFNIDTYTDENGDTMLTLALDRGDVEIAEMVLNHASIQQRPALEIAAERGHVAFVEAVLSSGPSKYRTADRIDMALARAAAAGQLRVVETLLAAGANPDNGQVNIDPGSPIVLATKNGHVVVVETLLAASANVELAGVDGNMALAVAALDNHATIVDILVAAGAKTKSALTAAVMGGHLNMVRKLLGYGAEVGRSALVQAACRDHRDIANMLLAAYGTVSEDECSGCTASVAHSLRCRRHKTSFDVDACRDAHGYTALLLAAKNGLADVAKMLLDAGATIDQVHTKKHSSQGPISHDSRVHEFARVGDTALMLASSGGHIGVVEALLAAGAVADHETLLRAMKNRHARVVDALLAAVAPADAPRYHGGSRALVIAASRGHTSIVDSLLTAGASVDSAGPDGITALIAAATHGRHATIIRLLASGADVRPAAHRRMTALALAAKGGHKRVVKTLVDHAVETDLLAEAATSALVSAAEVGHQGVVAMLLAAGVNVNYNDYFGKTALFRASEHDHAAIVDMLLAAWADVGDPGVLVVAAESGHAEVVEKLLAAGVNPQLPRMGFGRRSALYRAVEKGHVEVVKKLLAGGAPFYPGSGEQISVFLKACKTGRVEVVEALINAGALFYGSESGSRRSTHELYANGIHIAAEADNVELLELLVSNGVNVNARRHHRTLVPKRPRISDKSSAPSERGVAKIESQNLPINE